MENNRDYNAPTDSRAWQVFLLLTFLVFAGLNGYLVVSLRNVGWLGARLFTYPNITRVREVAKGSEAERAGIRSGDQLMAVEDMKFLSADCSERAMTLSEMGRYLQLTQLGAVRNVTYCRKNPIGQPGPPAQTITARLTVIEWPLYMRVNYYLSRPIFYLGLFILLWYLCRKSATLAMRLFCLAWIPLAIGFNTIEKVPYSLVYIFIGNFVGKVWFTVLLHLFLIWPSRHPLIKKLPSAPFWLYAFCMANIVFQIVGEVKNLNFIDPMIFDIVTNSGYFFVVMAVCVILVTQQYRMTSDWKRQQFRWFFLSFIIFMPVFIMIVSYFIAYRMVGEPSELMNTLDKWLYQVFQYMFSAWFMTVIVTGVMALTGFRLDLAETAAAKSLKYSITYTLLGAVLLAVAGCLAYSAQEYAVIKAPWAIIGITILAVVLVYPVQKYLGQRLDRRFRGRIQDLREFKDRVDEFILSELEPGKLINQVLEKLQGILDCSTAFVFLRAAPGGPDWRLAAFIQLSSADTERLAAGPPLELLRLLDEKPEPTSKIKLLSRTRLDIRQEIREDLVSVIESIRTDAVVPVLSRGCMKGIMCLGPKPKKGVYTAEELGLLGQIAAKVGLGLANALTYETVKNEMESRTNELKRLTARMKYYLSPQLVEALAGEEDEHVRTIKQRVKLTVFFSDIKGFTETTDRMEPEEMAEMLNHYLTEMSAIAIKHGGTIDKYVGDAIMVFFGAPRFTDDRDHALRCVRMAWEMQERMRALGEEWRNQGIATPLQIRIGVNTGYAAVGSFGSPERLDYTAIGSQVNLASRLEAQCEPGKIIVSFSTNALIQDEFETASRGELEVKGLHYPVQIFEVVGLK